MPPSSPSRGPVTTHLLGHLKVADFPVGDNGAPDTPHGWQGEPDGENTTFIPWLVLVSGQGVPQNPPGAMGDTGSEWRLNYSVSYAGVSRKQTEALADLCRDDLVSITRESLDTPTGAWRIQKVSCTSIGGTTRIGSAFPDYFTQTDIFDVWITKEK